MSVRPLFKGFALTFILYNCRKRDYKQKFKKLEKSNLFVVENHQKMCPSWKDTKFYELGLIFII